MAINDIFKQNKKNKPTTCYDLLDPKMVVHILGGAWAKIDELEGNHSLTILKYHGELRDITENSQLYHIDLFFLRNTLLA